MPTNFGKVFRASVRDNPNNPLATQLFVVSRNSQGNLILSPDTLKENMSIYLSKFRLISDAVDIVDAAIINIGIKYSVSLSKGMSKLGVLQAVNSKLKAYFNIRNFQIDQPILIGEVENIILNCTGVISLLSLKFVNIAGMSEDRIYSDFRYSPNRNIDRGFMFPPPGGIFEIRFPNDDIVGSVL
jgi:hypothetical protein